MRVHRGTRARSALILLALALIAAACDARSEAATQSAPAPTTTTAAPSGSPSMPSGGNNGPTTTLPMVTTAPPPPTTTTSPPPPSYGPLTRTDTGLTRIRVAIDTQADWVSYTLNGAEIKASRVIETTGNARFTSMGPNISLAGVGTAIVDFVLYIPPNSGTWLSMCKNYLGPATFTFTRMTDTPTVVGTFANSGTNTAVPPGSCENYAQQAIPRADLIGPVRWPARIDERPLVLAAYYPWYDDAALTRNFGDQPVGPANTVDPAIVRQAVNLAADNGIDGFVVEYEGTPALDASIDTLYAAAQQRNGFKAAMLLDLDVLTQRDGVLGNDELDTALAKVAQRNNHPSQLHVGSQPVVFLYGARFLASGQWSGAVGRLQAATGVVPFVVSDDPAMGTPGQYLYSTNNLGTVDQLLQWVNGTVLNLRANPGLIGNQGPLWVAPVSPGYDDRRLGRPSPSAIDRQGGQRYNDQWTASLGTLPDWIFISSWNEYYEQSHIMPGNTTGTTALDQTKVWASSFHVTG